MAVHEFRDNDDAYLAWLAAHPGGSVINILHTCNATGARRHRAECRTISGRNPRDGKWTWPYVKVCANLLAELDQWAIDRVGKTITPCGTCRPGGLVIGPRSANQTTKAEMVPAPEGRFLIDGPTPGTPVVQVWADDYVRFGDHCAWRKSLRAAILSRCGQLEPPAGHLLHAAFFGPKRRDADVENPVLYNIGTFPSAGRNGIRFEYGAAVPPAPDGAQYRFCYRYALEAR